MSNDTNASTYRNPETVTHQGQAIQLASKNISGLAYEYYEYESTKKSFPGFDDLDPIETGVTASFSFHEIDHRDKYFAVKFSGYIYAPDDGTYTFYTRSDDGTRLYLDDELLVDNWGKHDPKTKHEDVTLDEGIHKIALEYTQFSGGTYLSARWSGPSVTTKEIPPDVLFRDRTTQHAFTYRHKLEYARYRAKKSGDFPNFKDEYPKEREFIDTPDFSFDESGKHVAYRLIGYLDVPTAGEYEFDVHSADKRILSLDGEKVIDGSEGPGTIRLDAGMCRLDVHYLKKSSKGELKVTWTRPDGTSEVLPADRLYHKAAVSSGLNYKYYRPEKPDERKHTDEFLQYRRMPAFDTNPDKTGTLDGFDLKDDWSGSFGTKYTAHVRAPKDGEYTFYTESTDGSQLFVDGALIVDNDGRHSKTEVSGRTSLEGGWHKIVVEFFNGSHDASLDVNWKPPGGSKEPIDAAKLITSLSDGLDGADSGVEYELYRPGMPQLDPPVPEDAGVVPDAMLDGLYDRKEYIALTYDGYVYAPRDGEYTFHTWSDDGSRLFVDGALIVDNGGTHSGKWASGSISLAAGFHKLDVEYFNGLGARHLKVRWTKPGTSSKRPLCGYLHSERPNVSVPYYRVLRTDQTDSDGPKRSESDEIERRRQHAGQDYWGTYRELPVPRAVAPAGCSLLTTDRTPRTKPDLQVCSDDEYLYLFRASDHHVYANRYVLREVADEDAESMRNEREQRTHPELHPAWQVRYKRSESPDLPGGEEDTFGYRNQDGDPFYEPVYELPFGGTDGFTFGEQPEFAVELVPTDKTDERRWQFFVVDRVGGELYCYSIPKTDDGLFDVEDRFDGESETIEPDSIVQLQRGDSGDVGELLAAGPPSSTLYQDQEPIVTEDGESLTMKSVTKLLLAMPVEAPSTYPKGIAMLDFTIGVDGVPARLGPPVESESQPASDRRQQLAIGRIAPVEQGIEFDEYASAEIDRDSSVDVPEAFTQEIWMYATSADDGVNDLWGSHDERAEDAPSIAVVDERRIRVGFGDGENFRTAETKTDVLVTNGWNHVAAVFEDSSYTLYVNGEEVELVDADFEDARPTAILPDEFGTDFVGTLTEARLWNVARSAEQIRKHRDERLEAPADEDSLVGYWRMNEGEGSTVPDRSHNDSELALSGARWVSAFPPLDAETSPRTYFDERYLPLSVGLAEPDVGSDFGSLADGSRPKLLAGGDGLVHLYYQGTKDEFSVSQYDTSASRASYRIPWIAGTTEVGLLDEGDAYFISRGLGTNFNDATITFEENDGQVDLTLSDDRAADTDVESWVGLPKRVDQIEAILAGSAIENPLDPDVRDPETVFYNYSGDRTLGFVPVGSAAEGSNLLFVSHQTLDDDPRLLPASVELSTNDDGTGDVSVTLAPRQADSDDDGSQRVKKTMTDVPLDGRFADVVNGAAREDVYDYDDGGTTERGGLFRIGTNATPVLVAFTDLDCTDGPEIVIEDGDDDDHCDVSITLEAHPKSPSWEHFSWEVDSVSATWENVPRNVVEFVEYFREAKRDGSDDTDADAILSNLYLHEVIGHNPEEATPRVHNATITEEASLHALASFYECLFDGPHGSVFDGVDAFTCSMDVKQGATLSNEPTRYDGVAVSEADTLKRHGSELFSFVHPAEPENEFSPRIDVPSGGSVSAKLVAAGDDGGWVHEPPRHAVKFSGDNWVEVTENRGSLTTVGDRTIEAWVKPDSSSADQRFVNACSSGSHALDEMDDYFLGKTHGNKLVAAVHDQVAVSTDHILESNRWNHVAAGYESHHGVNLDKKRYGNCGNSRTLQPEQQFTVAAQIRVPEGGNPGPIFSKEDDDGVNYEVGINIYKEKIHGIKIKTYLPYFTVNAKVEDEDGKPTEKTVRFNMVPVPDLGDVWDEHPSESEILDENSAGIHYQDENLSERYLSVVIACDATGMIVETDGDETDDRTKTYELLNGSAMINGKKYTRWPKKYHRFDLKKSDGDAMIGWSSERHTILGGEVAELMVWDEYLDTDDQRELHRVGNLGAVDADPVSHWTFEEQQGDVAFDQKLDNDAHFKRVGEKDISEQLLWTTFPGTLSLWVNGGRVDVDGSKSVDNLGGYGRDGQVTFGGMVNSDGDPKQRFTGELDDVRIWAENRTAGQLADNMYRELTGRESNLKGYWAFDTGTGSRIIDRTGGGATARFHEDPDEHGNWTESTAPVSNEAPVVRNVIGGVTIPQQVKTTQPPAVVEYADIQRDEDGELFGVMKRAYLYTEDGEIQSSLGFSVGKLQRAYLGQMQTAPTLVGYVEGPPPLPSENLTRPYYRNPIGGPYLRYDGSSSIGLTETESVDVSLSGSRALGAQQHFGLKAGFKHSWELGTQKGLMFALTTTNSKGSFNTGLNFSQDFSTTQQRGMSMASGRTSTITNRMENGGDWERGQSDSWLLDERRYLPDNEGYALVKSRTADLYGFFHESSGRMVARGVSPDPEIPEDVNIIYFPMSTDYVKNGTLDGQIGLRTDPDYRGSDGRGSYFKPVEAYNLEQQVDRQNQKLQTYYDQTLRSQETTNQVHISLASSPFTSGGGFGDDEDGETDTVRGQEAPYYDWTEDEPTRDLANTYVWTAAGGLYSETQSTTSILQESFGVASSLSLSGGFDLGLEAMFGEGAMYGYSLELDFMAGATMTVNASKQRTRTEGIGLEVSADPEGYLNKFEAYDGTDDDPETIPYSEEPVPGKVDAYRFKTFFLSPKTESTDEFFDQVIDRNWLERSDDPRAAALRNARVNSAGTETWRILHRTTYVSRIQPEFHDAPNTASAPEISEPANKTANGLLFDLVQSHLPVGGDPTPTQLGTAIQKVFEEDLGELLPWWGRFNRAAAVPNSEPARTKHLLIEDVLKYFNQYFEAKRYEKLHNG